MSGDFVLLSYPEFAELDRNYCPVSDALDWTFCTSSLFAKFDQWIETFHELLDEDSHEKVGLLHLLNDDTMLSEVLVAVSSQESYPFCNSHCEDERWSMTNDVDDDMIARMKLTEEDPEHDCEEVAAFFDAVSTLISGNYQTPLGRDEDGFPNKIAGRYDFVIQHALSIQAMLLIELNRTCSAMGDVDSAKKQEDLIEQVSERIASTEHRVTNVYH